MLTGYEDFGFHICAKVLPDACTACPFWWYSTADDTGMCAITGQRIKADGKHDFERMSKCPIERWPKTDGESV